MKYLLAIIFPFLFGWNTFAEEPVHPKKQLTSLFVYDMLGGQVHNKFEESVSITDILFGFRMSCYKNDPDTHVPIPLKVEGMKIGFTTTHGVSNTDVCNAQLWEDVNKNGTVDAGDILVEGGIPGIHGQLTFTNDFFPPNSGPSPKDANYIVKVTVSNVGIGDETMFSIRPDGIDLEDKDVFVSVNVTDARHVAWDKIVPNANASPVVAGLGDRITLSCSPTGGTGIYSIIWTGPNNFTLSGKTASFDAYLTGRSTYAVHVSDTDGKTATEGVEVVISESGIVVNAKASSTFVMSGDTVSLGCDPTGGSGSYSYLWSGPDGFVSADKNIENVILNNKGVNTFQITVTDDTGLSKTENIDITVSLPEQKGMEVISIRYKVDGASIPGRGRNSYSFKVRGLQLKPWDKLEIRLNGLRIGNIEGNTLVLDHKNRFRGDVANGNSYFAVSARYSNGTLNIIANKSYGGSNVMFATDSSYVSDPVKVEILVSRDNGTVDLLYLSNVRFYIKTRTRNDGTKIEKGINFK